MGTVPWAYSCVQRPQQVPKCAHGAQPPHCGLLRICSGHALTRPSPRPHRVPPSTPHVRRGQRSPLHFPHVLCPLRPPSPVHHLGREGSRGERAISRGGISAGGSRAIRPPRPLSRPAKAKHAQRLLRHQRRGRHLLPTLRPPPFSSSGARSSLCTPLSLPTQFRLCTHFSSPLPASSQS